MSTLLRLFGAVTRHVSPATNLVQRRQFSWKIFRAVFKFEKPEQLKIVLPPLEREPQYIKPIPRRPVPKKVRQVNAVKVKSKKQVPKESEEILEYKKKMYALRSRMVERKVPISKNCIEGFQKRLGDFAIQIENKKLSEEVFKKRDQLVVLDASVQQNRAVAATIIFHKDQSQPDVRTFIGKKVKKSVDAECLPMLHFLRKPNQRIRFVTDQKPLVDAFKKGHSKNPVLNAVISELKKSPESDIIWIPSKNYSPYKMCHFLAGFIARQSASSLQSTSEAEEEKINKQVQSLKIDDTFCSLPRYD